MEAKISIYEYVDYGDGSFSAWGHKQYHLCKKCANRRGLAFGDVCYNGVCYSCKEKRTVQSHYNVPDYLYTEDERRAMDVLHEEFITKYNTLDQMLISEQTRISFREEYNKRFSEIIGEERAAEFWKIWNVWT